MADDPPTEPDDATRHYMDVDMDGDIDANDVTFVLLALAKKYRFLVPADASGALVGFDGCTVIIKLRDDANAPVANAAKTRVRLEIGTATSNEDSVIMMMAGPDADGAFTATIPTTIPASLRTGVMGFVAMVETLTDDGTTETQRKFAWRGTTFGSYGEAGMVWEPLLATTVSCDGTFAPTQAPSLPSVAPTASPSISPSDATHGPTLSPSVSAACEVNPRCREQGFTIGTCCPNEISGSYLSCCDNTRAPTLLPSSSPSESPSNVPSAAIHFKPTSSSTIFLAAGGGIAALMCFLCVCYCRHRRKHAREERRRQDEMKKELREKGRDADRPGPDLRRSAAQLGLAGSAGRRNHLGVKPADDDDLMMFLRSSFKRRASRSPRTPRRDADDDDDLDNLDKAAEDGLDKAAGPKSDEVFEVARRHTRRTSVEGGQSLFRGSSRRIMNAQRIAAAAKNKERRQTRPKNAGSRGDPRVAAKASLEQFYQKADPSKVANIDAIIDKYGDDVEKLFASLEAKYPGMKVERPASDPKSGHTRRKRRLSFKDAGKKIGIVAATLGPSMRKKKIIKSAFAKIDADHSGSIDFEEFVAVCESDDREAVRALFDMLDEDHSGTIEQKELPVNILQNTFFRSNALHCTATACILIPAECSAVP